MNKDGLKTLLDSSAVGRSESQEGKKILEGHNKAFSTTLKFLILILDFFLSTYMALLGPTHLFIFGKSSHLHSPRFRRLWIVHTEAAFYPISQKKYCFSYDCLGMYVIMSTYPGQL